MLKKIQNFLTNEEGASAVEYGLIVGLIAVAIVVAATLVGTNLNGLFNGIAGQLGTATPGG